MEYTLGRHYVPPGDGLWPMPGEHQVAAPLTALSRRELNATHSAIPSICGMNSFGSSAESTQSNQLPYIAGRALLFQLEFHQ